MLGASFHGPYSVPLHQADMVSDRWSDDYMGAVLINCRGSTNHSSRLMVDCRKFH